MSGKVRLAQLETLRAVAKTLSYTRAAEMLGYSVPAVYQQIRALEAALNVSLFEVHLHRIDLTPIAGEVVQLAEQVMAGVDRIVAVASSFEAQRKRQVLIGAGHASSCFLLRYVLPPLERECPEFQVRVVTRVRDPSTVIPDLLSGEYDLGVVLGEPLAQARTKTSDEVCVSPWLREELVLVKQVSQEPVIRARNEPRRIYYLTSHLKNNPSLAGLLSSTWQPLPIRCVALDTIGAVKSAVNGGLGEALLPAMGAIGELKDGVFERVPFPAVVNRRFIVTLHNAPPPVRALREFLLNWGPPECFGESGIKA